MRVAHMLVDEDDEEEGIVSSRFFPACGESETLLGVYIYERLECALQVQAGEFEKRNTSSERDELVAVTRASNDGTCLLRDNAPLLFCF
jgi:hypothetical protein